MTRENKFIGILFECCNIYRRIYVNKEKNAYEGKCPKCKRKLNVDYEEDMVYCYKGCYKNYFGDVIFEKGIL